MPQEKGRTLRVGERLRELGLTLPGPLRILPDLKFPSSTVFPI